jgi:nitric oxide reductase NorD protein
MGLLDRIRGGQTPAPEPSDDVALEDVRRRLELLLAAVYGHPVTVAAADPPRAPGPLSRLFRRIPAHMAAPDALPASDGERVLLPPRLEPGRGGDPLARYRVMAMQQAERLARGTVIALPEDEPPLVRDLYLLAESAAADDAVARTAPGLARALSEERASALTRRPALDALTPAEREVERLVRGVLSGAAAVPKSLDPADSLAWARKTAARLQARGGGRYRGLPGVITWGIVLPAAPGAGAVQVALAAGAIQAERSFWGMDTDKEGAGAAGREAEENQSATHFEEHDAATDDVTEAQTRAGSGGSADPEYHQVESGSPSSISEVDGAASTAATPPPAAIVYPEWDANGGRYRPHGAWVRIDPTAAGDVEWAHETLRGHGAVVRKLRQEFERLRARRQRLTQQRDGEELDLAACVRALVDLRTGQAVSDRLYAAVRPARRELAILLLVDISGSTSEPLRGVRVIDVEKTALLLAGEAFEALGDRYAILTFSGQAATNVRIRVVKSFAERGGDEVRGRIAALRPEGYTRMGAAVRHAAALLAKEPAKHRLLLILSDGKPNDDDHYQGRYAVEDTRQAVSEARASGIFPFCLTVDDKASAYLPRIFGTTGHMILTHPEHLPTALLKVVRGLLRG